MKRIGFILMIALAAGLIGVPLVFAETAGSSTLDNLQTAYNGERNANVKYLAYAKKADEEGYGRAANLFRAAARAEQVHFERHAQIIAKTGTIPKADIQTPAVKSTKENLEDAFKGETYESTEMYPQFLKQARKEKAEAALDPFEDALKAEAVHAKLYKSVLNNMNAWKAPASGFYVCPLCGNVVEKRSKGKCPICKTPMAQFMLVS